MPFLYRLKISIILCQIWQHFSRKSRDSRQPIRATAERGIGAKLSATLAHHLHPPACLVAKNGGGPWYRLKDTCDATKPPGPTSKDCVIDFDGVDLTATVATTEAEDDCCCCCWDASALCD
jgi:hypothetical protein